MNRPHLLELLESVETGKTTARQALAKLASFPFDDVGFARVDHHRALRQGFPEVVFGEGNTPEQIAGIVRSLLRHSLSEAQQNKALVEICEKIEAAYGGS